MLSQCNRKLENKTDNIYINVLFLFFTCYNNEFHSYLGFINNNKMPKAADGSRNHLVNQPCTTLSDALNGQTWNKH